MYGGVVKCPTCGYEFYCETINSTIDCPRCSTVIGLQPLPEPTAQTTGAVVEEEG